ncbi:MAG: hypothetical protein EBQ80_03425 [Proteobacteria bacterium]|nr:hypothetical protein [Pseudomonadota bacterium]
MIGFVVPLWVWMALGFSFCGAVIVAYNQWAKLDGRALVVGRVVGIWPLAGLSLVFFPWPVEWQFYAVAALMGVGLAYADVCLFNASRKHGARLTAMYVPLKMLLAFGLWVMINPMSLLPVLSVWWKVVLLVVGFGLCSGALGNIRRSDTGLRALVAVLPVAVLFALADVVAKHLLGEVGGNWSDVVGRAVAFLAVTSTVGAVGGVIFGGLPRYKRRQFLRAAGFGVTLLMSLTLLLLTIWLAPNPGYVAAITMLSGLWLAFYGRFMRGERNNWWAGLVLLLGALCVGLAVV